MDRAEDFVTEVRAGLGSPAIPWRRVRGKPLGTFAQGRAELRDEELRLWYETEQGPVSPVAAVPLAL